MARTSSTMLKLGVTAPPFALLEPASGKIVCIKEFSGQPLVVAFICNHCPYVKHIISTFSSVAKKYRDKVAFVAINSNDAGQYPDDAPDKMVEFAHMHDFSFPYLFDESQSIAKAYRAACTPDLYLFDNEHRLVYRGQFDDSRPRNDEPVTGHDLNVALDALLSGKLIPEEQKPSLGCNIKWREGSEPDYFG